MMIKVVFLYRNIKESSLCGLFKEPSHPHGCFYVIFLKVNMTFRLLKVKRDLWVILLDSKETINTRPLDFNTNVLNCRLDGERYFFLFFVKVLNYPFLKPRQGKTPWGGIFTSKALLAEGQR